MRKTTVPILPTGDVAQRVLRIVAEQSDQPVETLNRETNLGGELLDSLATTELIMEIEDELEISIPDDDVQQVKTIGELIDLAVRLLANRRGADADANPPASP